MELESLRIHQCRISVCNFILHLWIGCSFPNQEFVVRSSKEGKGRTTFDLKRERERKKKSRKTKKKKKKPFSFFFFFP